VTLFHDLDCDGVAEAGEPVLSGAVPLATGETLCLVARHAAPAGAPAGAAEVASLTAAFSYTGAAPALDAALALDDVTTVTAHGLLITKSVDAASIRPGDPLTHAIRSWCGSSSPHGRLSGAMPDPTRLDDAPRENPPRLYSEFAKWWPLMSPPSDYVEEAADLLPELLAAATPAPRTLLELGSGGGSLAFHLKSALRLTLTDRSEAMLAVSRVVNPECEHVAGDMRTLDLGRTFDLVLIHDAVMYATTGADVRAALATAARHCRPGGALAVLPDCVTETFAPDHAVGGRDAEDGRGLRYLEWSWDPDPADDTFETVYVMAMREVDGTLNIESDRHRLGLFPRAAWLRWIEEAGFTPRVRTDAWARDVFVGIRR